MKTRLSVVVAVLLAFSLFAVSCGNDDDDSSDAVVAGDPTVEATPTPQGENGSSGGATGSTDPTSDAEPAPEPEPTEEVLVVSPGVAEEFEDGVVPTGNTGFIPGAIISTECTDGRPVGGNLTIGMYAETNGWDPTTVIGGVEAGELHLMALFDSLFYLDLTTSELVPAMAQSITTEDNQTFVLSLRDDVTFSDGTRFDVDAFIWNVEHYKNTPGSRVIARASDVMEMNKIDDFTVEVITESVNAVFPLSLAGRLGKMMSPTTYQAGIDPDTGLNPEINVNPVGIGAGPFLFESWIQDDVAVVVRNPDYYRAPCPYLDSVTFKPIVDSAQRYNAYQAGDLDVVYLRDAGSLNEELEAGSNISTYVDNFARHWLLNNSKEPFSVRACRRAVAHAVDYEVLNDVVHDGLTTVNRSLFRPGSPWADPEAVIPDYDPDAAREALGECEAELGGPLEFESLCSSDESGVTAEILVAMWTEVGITATANCVSTGEMVAAAFAGESIANDWAGTIADPDGLYAIFYGDSPEDGVCGPNRSASNYGFACYPELDEALEQGRQGLTFEERYAAYSRFQRKWAEEVPVILTFKTGRGYVYTDEVSGMMQTFNFVTLPQFTAKG
ncbi:MAG: ABC transporter substrate-binding protein [bacterium]|nr:ABC transporter substrate-binding protein [bacterium]